MKILLFSDIHYCQYSSIVRSRGEKYSTRIEYLLKTMNWIEKKAISENCDLEICLGDFFDRADLNAEEITSLAEIEWNSLPHYFIVGNHETTTADLSYNSTKILSKPNFTIVEKPLKLHLEDFNIYFLPYIVEDNRKPIKEYLEDFDEQEKNVILSHNDIKGYNFGNLVSQSGFTIEEIEDLNTLYLNGHLHNSNWVSKHILNVGNTIGLNFSEDAFNYQHNVWILDTENLNLTAIENPYSLNFYKLEDKIPIKKLKDNLVLSITCKSENVEKVKEQLETIKDKIVAYKISVSYTKENQDEKSLEKEKVLDTSNYLDKFSNFVYNKLSNSLEPNLLKSEINEIIK